MPSIVKQTMQRLLVNEQALAERLEEQCSLNHAQRFEIRCAPQLLYRAVYCKACG